MEDYLVLYNHTYRLVGRGASVMPGSPFSPSAVSGAFTVMMLVIIILPAAFNK